MGWLYLEKYLKELIATDFLLTRKIYNFGHILWPQERCCYTSEILTQVAAKNIYDPYTYTLFYICFCFVFN